MSASTHKPGAGRAPEDPAIPNPEDRPSTQADPTSPSAPPSKAGDAEDTPKGSATREPAPAEAEPDYRDRWLRAEAEFQNYRRRATREWEEGRRAAQEDVLIEMVLALDDLERAIDAARDAGVAAAWIEGVSLVAQRMRDALARCGVTVEDPVGKPFDPAFHEALLEVDAPAGVAAGAVVQVVHKGYRRGDRALRAARVVVARVPGGGN